MSDVSDLQLIERARAGSRSDLCDLIARYERRVYSLAFRIMGNHTDAADAAQEALVRVYTCFHTFQGNSAFSTWLFRVATNVCLDERRRQSRRSCISLDDPQANLEPRSAQQIIDKQDNPADRFEQQEIQEAVQRAVNRLPQGYRAIVVLRDLQGYSYHEIAELLGTSMGTVKSRLHRARMALRPLLLAEKSTEEFHQIA